MKALILLLIVSNALSLLSVNGIVAASEIDTVIDIDTEAIIIEAARAEIDGMLDIQFYYLVNGE